MRACVRVYVCAWDTRMIVRAARFPLSLISSYESDNCVLVSRREGQPVIFDDSFRHEVFASPSAEALGTVDALRVVLIVDIWHPDIPVSQRPLLLERLWEREQAASSFQL